MINQKNQHFRNRCEGSTHVYLNGKMMQEFTFLLAEIGITSPALSGDTLRP
jgi:LPS sulfotransferase NodH